MRRALVDGEGGIMALLGLAAHSEADQRRRTVLLMVGIAGAALFYGDGIITPAISVLSALVLAYPDAVDSPFFNLLPGWALVPVVLLATAATVIASQAVISGAFSLTQRRPQWRDTMLQISKHKDFAPK